MQIFADASAPKVVVSASASEVDNTIHETETLDVDDSAIASVLDLPEKHEAVTVAPAPEAVDPGPKRKRRRANHPLHGWPPTLGPSCQNFVCMYCVVSENYSECASISILLHMRVRTCLFCGLIHRLCYWLLVILTVASC